MTPKMKKRLSDEEYKFVFTNTPRLCIDLIILTDHGFLLAKRQIPPFEGLWHFPGGRVFYKESLDEAIQRIAKTETGLNVKKEGLVGLFEILEDGPFIHSVPAVFSARTTGGKVMGNWQGKEVTAFKEIPEKIHPYHKKFLEDHWKEISEK